MALPATYALSTDEVGHLATVSLSTGTADTNYPVANVQTFDPSRPFLTSSSATVVDIDWDHTTAKDVQLFSLHHHNIPAGTICHLYRGATQGATTLDASFTIGTYANTGLPLPVGIDLTAVSGYSGAGFRWTRLRIPSLAQKVGVGSALLWNAKRQDITNVLYPTNESDTHPKRVFRMAFGPKNTYYMRVRLRSQSVVFRVGQEAQFAAVLALFRSCQAGSNAFLWWRDSTGSDAWLAGFPEDALRHVILTRQIVHEVTTSIDELACGQALPTA